MIYIRHKNNHLYITVPAYDIYDREPAMFYVSNFDYPFLMPMIGENILDNTDDSSTEDTMNSSHITSHSGDNLSRFDS